MESENQDQECQYERGESPDSALLKVLDECCLPADEPEAGPIRELLIMPDLYIVRVLATMRGMGGVSYGRNDERGDISGVPIVLVMA